MEWSKYNHLFYSKKVGAYLLYSSISNMLIELDDSSYEEILKLKKNPNLISKEDSEHLTLLDGRFFVDSNESEVNKIVLSNLSQRFNYQQLSLSIAPTRACNFNCSYCYETDRINERMSIEVQQGVIEFAKKYDNLKNIFVTWYGGEPTLELPAMLTISRGLKQIVENYSAFLVTNGYLLDKIEKHLEEMSIHSIQITLDGVEKSHNATRSLKNGTGSFAKIISNIDKIISKPINISIRMNIDTNNAESFIELLHFLNSRYSNYKNISLYPAFIHNYTGACKADSCYDDSFSKAIFLKNLFEKHKVYTPEIYPFRTSKGCMCQKMNSFLIAPDGSLYKCWHHLGISDKIVGNIFNENIITNQNQLADMMLQGDTLFISECQECILFPSCNGGCSDLRKKNESVCIPAKSLLEDFLNIHYKLKTWQEGNISNKI